VGFRTGWFLESVVSAALVVLVVRTRRRILTTPPSVPLTIATACAIIAALVLPFTPIAHALGFRAVPVRFAGAMAVIVTLYIVAAEAAKRWFYRREEALVFGRSSSAHAAPLTWFHPLGWFRMAVTSSRKGE
jgi:Mg2+-importing ATPase